MQVTIYECQDTGAIIPVQAYKDPSVRLAVLGLDKLLT